MSKNSNEETRHSRADAPQLVTDPAARAEREVRNALRQFDRAAEVIESFIRPPERLFRLRASLILDLHRIALEGLSSYAGIYRPAGVTIGGSDHVPPPGHLVPHLVEELCDYVNDHWDQASAIHLAAYVMWRLNWIHPFDDGNGRTSRMVAYIVLCARLGYQLPGRNTIPEQIAEDKSPYYDALERADAASRDGKIDVSRLEKLVEGMLARQLLYLLEGAKEDGLKNQGRPAKLH